MTGTPLVHADYNGLGVSFTEDAWFNATEVSVRFGKRVDHYLANDDAQQYIAALCEGENTRKVGDYVQARRGRNGGTWMHPELAVHFARWLDVRFAIWCDRQIRALLTGQHPHYDWKRMRHEAASSFKVMTQVLQWRRQREGKGCAHHHYSNEATLVNWALTGVFGKVDRNGLSTVDLDVLAKLECRNAVLIGCGASREERKAELEQFARDERATTTLALDAPPLKVAA